MCNKSSKTISGDDRWLDWQLNRDFQNYSKLDAAFSLWIWRWRLDSRAQTRRHFLSDVSEPNHCFLAPHIIFTAWNLWNGGGGGEWIHCKVSLGFQKSALGACSIITPRAGNLLCEIAIKWVQVRLSYQLKIWTYSSYYIWISFTANVAQGSFVNVLLLTPALNSCPSGTIYSWLLIPGVLCTKLA